METSLFSFDLPPELIAQEPAQNRENARLLVLDRATGDDPGPARARHSRPRLRPERSWC